MPDHSEIALEMTFDAGHRIVGHKGKCARLHGHTYKACIVVAGQIQDPGFVIDFGDIKDLVNEWDHRLLLWENDPLAEAFDNRHTLLTGGNVRPMEYGVITLHFNPTAENMASNLAHRIYTGFPGVERVMVELWETPKSMARALR